MALKKITDADLEGKGVRGQPDVPGLTAEEMQRAVEQIVREVVIPILNGNVDEINTNYATKSDLYTHPTYTARASGFYKITVDGLGHVSDVSAVGKTDVVSLGIAPAEHSHTKSEITDFPTSLPASDVSAWAKATTKPEYTADEVGAISQDNLQNAINEALAQAKASGEFDGTSATHSWNGTVLSITSASGTSSADLKGADGYTPAKGTDYFTEADKTEMVNAVLAALPAAEGVNY